eukprot:Lithocolla_globosa_v1_NODE_4779_length_1368_cov_3.676314.p2 type:complete len:104 gc:universal NODE_4779_length_1368_cov_3.676314:1038-727(-)
MLQASAVVTVGFLRMVKMNKMNLWFMLKTQALMALSSMVRNLVVPNVKCLFTETNYNSLLVLKKNPEIVTLINILFFVQLTISPKKLLHLHLLQLEIFMTITF